jgi:hypothetical protein
MPVYPTADRHVPLYRYIPSDKYHKQHTHHTIYDVQATRTMDLKIFGQGHMLYFYFLKVCRNCGSSGSNMGSMARQLPSYPHACYMPACSMQSALPLHPMHACVMRMANHAHVALPCAPQ